MEIAHRTNTLDNFYKHYYDYNCRAFEIDVQFNKNSEEIIVYHDDISKETKLDKNVIMLYDFLRLTPDDITLNIEIKDYSGSKNYIKNDICACKICIENNPNKTCRSEKNSLIDLLIVVLKENNKKGYIISSFDKYICSNKTIRSKLEEDVSKDLIYLIGELGDYDKSFKKICIHKKFLEILNYNNHDLIYVYDIKREDIDDFKEDYPFVNGWILDY